MKKMEIGRKIINFKAESTNKDEFLTDETGSVRWLCFELIGKMNFTYKDKININDIWRQAYSLYKSGFAYQLTPEEIEENEIKLDKDFKLIEDDKKYKSDCKKDDIIYIRRLKNNEYNNSSPTGDKKYYYSQNYILSSNGYDPSFTSIENVTNEINLFLDL